MTMFRCHLCGHRYKSYKKHLESEVHKAAIELVGNRR